MGRKSNEPATLLGPPPKPSGAGSVGRGGARERHDGCPYLGVRNRADFVTTMPAGMDCLAKVTLSRNRGPGGKPPMGTAAGIVPRKASPGDSFVPF